MINIKQSGLKIYEVITLAIVYLILIVNALVFKDNLVAVLSAFFGITYTFMAGKGNPVCYLFGVSGSGLYGWLSMVNAIWGNLILYICYYVPMQIFGFIKWNKNLKQGKNEIVKTCLQKSEKIKILTITIILTGIFMCFLYCTNDKHPISDAITTIFSITGMYLTVKRCIEQWLVWILVNGVSSIMWISVAMSGEKVYSAVVMWVVYFGLAIYFYFDWKKELN